MVVADAATATTCDLVEIGKRMKAAREALGLSRPAFATKSGCSVRTLENNEKGANEAGVGLMSAFLLAGINTNWLLTGDGEMLLKAAPAAAVDAPWQAIPDVVKYPPPIGMAAMESFAGDAAPVVDVALLTRCMDACTEVYGKDFDARSPSVQVAYAADLYNLLSRMAGASRSAGAQAALLRLEVSGMAEQLRLYIKLGWARQFPPRALPRRAFIP